MPSAMSHRGRIWTLDEISEDCRQAEDHFRLRRISEPLDEYLSEYVAAKAAADTVINQLDAILAVPADQELLASIAGNQALFTALRYLSAPPISDDDLTTLLERRVSATALRRDQAYAARLVQVIRTSIDPKRFPWVHDGAQPSAAQLRTAKVASAVAATIQRVQTKRRGEEKKSLEGSVERLLLALNFTKATTPRESIDSMEGLPGPGEYMTEVTLARHNGDFVIGLFDRNRRRLALECKSSNSSINSRKRLNKEVVGDAAEWKRQFGSQVVTGAVLRGVFEPRYVHEAQSTPLLVFWSHRLDDLQSFIEATRG